MKLKKRTGLSKVGALALSPSIPWIVIDMPVQSGHISMAVWVIDKSQILNTMVFPKKLDQLFTRSALPINDSLQLPQL